MYPDTQNLSLWDLEATYANHPCRHDFLLQQSRGMNFQLLLQQIPIIRDSLPPLGTHLICREQLLFFFFFFKAISNLQKKLQVPSFFNYLSVTAALPPIQVYFLQTLPFSSSQEINICDLTCPITDTVSFDPLLR